MDALTVFSWLLEFSLRPLALCLVAACAIAMLRLKSPAAQHSVWTVAAGGMLLLAAIAIALPGVPVRVLPARTAPAGPIAVTALVDSPAGPLAPAPVPIAWDRIAAGIYVAGLLAFTTRLAYSYRLTQRLARSARPLQEFAGESVYESDVITVPLTLGWRDPKILLPADWTTWPGYKLEAVMVHERAHIARADWGIALLAGMNRCIFWFHPLAWWLERRLALLAELACDDAALMHVPSRTAYAEVLVEMADAVRRSGARVAWEAMAMARHSEVRQRVDRILDESRQALPGLTRARWIALVACALPLVYFSAAVRPARVQAQQSPARPAAQTAPQNLPQTAPETSEKLGELLREQERALALTQERLAETERQAELLRQQRLELEYRRNLANEADALAARVAQEPALQLQQQIAFTQRMEALKTQIAAMSEQLTPNHPALRRAQAELAALQARASRAGDDPAAVAQETARRTAQVREFLEFEIERLNAQLQEKRRELELLGGR